MQPWQGKQMWIWELNQSGDPQVVVDEAVALGLTGLLVKAWDGGSYWPQIEVMAGPAKAAGLTLGAWGYSYGSDPQAEGRAAAQALAVGADWLIVDAEMEYENDQGAERACCLGNVFKSLHTVPIVYTSFALTQCHPAFPWSQFSQWCDGVLPQVYWGDLQMPVAQALVLSVAGLQPYGRPIAPVGQCYGEVTPAEISRFAELARTMALPGISFWDWQHATPAMFDAVSRAPYSRRPVTGAGNVYYQEDEPGLWTALLHRRRRSSTPKIRGNSRNQGHDRRHVESQT